MVSVCMATYNGERFLKEQLDSIISELSPEDELVISDDGSSDNTLRIIEDFGDSRIKLFHNRTSHGVNNNFENALRNASGDFIFFADQDDIWIQGKVNKCVKHLLDSDCVIHDCFVTDSNLEIKDKSLFANINSGKGFIKNILHNSYSGSCMCIRRDLIPNILPFPKNTHFFYDQWIGLRTELKGNTMFINDKLIKFRRHDSSTSSAAGKSGLSFRERISYRISLIAHLFMFDLKKIFQ